MRPVLAPQTSTLNTDRLYLAVVLAAWGSSDPVADFNGDGQVDGQDLAVILAAWGSCTE